MSRARDDDRPNKEPPTLGQLAEVRRSRHDLFIGLVAPIGSSRSQVLDRLRESFGLYGYETKRVHLAGLLDTVDLGLPTPLPTRTQAGYYKKRMDAGDRLRRAAGDWSALAALAIADAARDRRTRTDKRDRPLAYVFDSLKHPREAELIRSVYGDAGWIVSIVQDTAERLANLADELGDSEGRFGAAPDAAARELVARDEADPEAPHGQHVRDVFAMADFFLPVRRGVNWTTNISRFCSGVFDEPFLTPSAEEQAMRFASAAALRSAAISRQVGAVIVPPGGAPYILGTNEVPKPGGGQFREGDQPDHRDFQSGSDPNPAYTERVLREVVDRFVRAGYFTTDRNEAGAALILQEATRPGKDGRSVLDGTRAKALIEFTRCLHAEQAAIVDAARTGTAIGGGRLFTTTFPCHECTKFIIGAGISELQYIEPYPKSLAGDMYRDLVDVQPPLEAGTGLASGKVPFRPFVGFGPRRYDEVFASHGRRGAALSEPTSRSAASPIGEWNERIALVGEQAVTLALEGARRSLALGEEAAGGNDSSQVPQSASGDASSIPGHAGSA